MGTNKKTDSDCPADSQQDLLEPAKNGSDTGRRSPSIVYAVRTPGDALHSATDRGDLMGITRILQASPDCVDARNARGRTSLHVAAQIGRNDIVKHLLQYGADVNARSGWHYTPLIFAAENVHSDVVVTLVRAGADLEAKTKQGNTAIHRAVLREKNNPDTVYALAVLGANVNTKNDKGETAIYTCIDKGKDINALVLCAFGANPLAKSSRGESAGELVARQEATGTYDSRVNISQVISDWTPESSIQKHRQQLIRFVQENSVIDLLGILCWACGKGHAAIVNFALQLPGDKAGLVESAETRRGWKPLHHAAAGGESGIARILLSHGAAVDTLTRTHKWTPLLLAAEHGRQRTVACLLENGADLLAETHEGTTAFDLAGDGRHPKTMNILGEHAIRLEDPARQQRALERFTRAKFSLERSDRHRVVNHRPKKPRSLSPRRGTETADPRRASASKLPESDSGKLLSPDPDHAYGSQESRDPSPSGISEDSQNTLSGSFDGGLYSLPTDRSNLSQSSTFDRLIKIWDYFDYKQRRDRPVKIAILDTGFDSSHPDFEYSRALRFQNSQPVRAGGEPRQRDRIRAWKDFTRESISTEADILDLDGHGTQVAGLILRLAPRSELYIARICEGNIQRGAIKPTKPSSSLLKTPQPDIAAAAIEWAIQQKVDIINLSFGFSSTRRSKESLRLRGALRDVLKKADRNHILVFAAMSNDGNNDPNGAAWPANESALSIGVHSCVEKGRRSSIFTPPPVPGSHNFMVEGERVVTHWPESKGGGFRLDEGTSFATPIAVSMAALILAFESQHLCKKDREEAEEMVDLEELRELRGMVKVLRHISAQVPESGYYYSYIYPELLWKGFNLAFEEDKDKVRKYAWDVIQDALSR